MTRSPSAEAIIISLQLTTKDATWVNETLLFCSSISTWASKTWVKKYAAEVATRTSAAMIWSDQMITTTTMMANWLRLVIRVTRFDICVQEEATF